MVIKLFCTTFVVEVLYVYMKSIKNILFILAISSLLFACNKEIIKPVNQTNSEKSVVISGYDDNGNPIYKEITDPDEDEDFEGASN